MVNYFFVCISPMDQSAGAPPAGLDVQQNHMTTSRRLAHVNLSLLSLCYFLKVFYTCKPNNVEAFIRKCSTSGMIMIKIDA